MDKRVWQRSVLLAALCTLGSLLALHFFMTYLHLSPLNPLKTEAWPVVTRYTQDLFSQNWSLFAPDPIHHNSALLVQCRIDGGEESDWYNISQGMNDGHDANPLGPHGRLARMHLTASRAFHANGDIATEQLRSSICKDDSESDFCRRQDERSQRVRKVGEEMLAGLGSAACGQVVAPGEAVEAVRLRLLQQAVRPWSKRNDPEWKPAVTGTETDWLPYRQVAPINVQLVGAGDHR